MTTEEIVQFQETIKETIIPLAMKMTTPQIEDIIRSVTEVDEKFKNIKLVIIGDVKMSKSS